MPRVSAHTQYRVGQDRVRSVTTIIGGNLGWDKQVLIGWARREAMAGRDPYKVRDQASAVGTLAHLLIQQQADPGVVINLEEWTGEQRELAERAYSAWQQWKALHQVESLETEISLVSEIHRFGGTLDWIVKLDGTLAYIDFKTSTGIYANHKIQVAAYLQLWHENRSQWLTPHILHLNKKTGEFSHHRLENLQPWWEVFLHLLALQRLKDRLGE